MIGLLGSSLIFTSCGDDDAPGEENDPEIITNVSLIFTNTADATDIVTATAVDPDGTGALELTVSGPINLSAQTTYTLTYSILNALDPDDIEDVLADDIAMELEEHQLFYSFSTDAFSSPTGSGNIGATGTINYEDEDANGNPVGLRTTWTTGGTLSGGSFTARLQHQPDEKSATSTSSTGDTDFNLVFVLNIN